MFAKLMSQHHSGEELVAPLTVRAVLLAFLEDCKRHKSEATYHFYATAIAGTSKKAKSFVSFDEYLGADMLVEDFGPEVVHGWINKHFSRAGDNYKHNLIRAVQAAFNWARVNRRDWRVQLADNPLAGLKKPSQTPREAYISPDQWAKVLETATGEFLDFLVVLKETGARPQEARVAEAQHFDRAGRRLYFPKPVKKVRGAPRPRVILLNDRTFAIFERLADKYPEGPLFRNEDGRPWTRNALNCRCRTMRDKLGFAFIPYALRHTFCTDALIRGVDPLTVAELMGHRNGEMVMRVYQNLGKCDGHLRAALERATAAS